MLSEDAAVHRGAPPSLANPVSGPAQLVSTLWSSFGPGILASGAALVRQAQNAASASSAQAASLASPPRTNTSQSIVERRQRLEAELAALAFESQETEAPPAMPIPAASGAFSQPSRTPSDESGAPGLRERTTSTSKFEEVEVPSDAEGDNEQGYARPSSTKNTSWFGWGGGGGYERVKNE